MTKKPSFAAILCLLLFGVLCGPPGVTNLRAQTTSAPATKSKIPTDPTQKELSTQMGPAPTPSQKYFTDVLLVNQDGEPMRFYSDLLKGKVVIISSFMANCASGCPSKNRNMEKIQEALGDRLGKQAHLISITVDPLNDTPQKLREYAARFHARRGWYFLSGKKENVDWALYKLGQYVENKDDHINIIIIGNESTGLWKKAFALAKPDELIKEVESAINDKGEAAK